MVYNIEATSTHPGSFASDPDDVYIQRSKLPKRAITCGSDLQKLTARQMLGAFVGLRARHYKDVGNLHAADLDYALSRVLFPESRSAYIGGMIPFIHRGSVLFERGELGHPDSLFADLAPVFSPRVYNAGLAGIDVSVPAQPSPAVHVVSKPVLESNFFVTKP